MIATELIALESGSSSCQSDRLSQISRSAVACFEGMQTGRGPAGRSGRRAKPSGMRDLGWAASCRSCCGRRRVVAIAVANDDDILVLFDDHAGEDPAVGHGDDGADESFANLGAGVDDIQEHRLQIVAPVSGQVGADLSSLAEERMATGALLVKDLLAGLGDSGPSRMTEARRSMRACSSADRGGLDRAPQTGGHDR